MCHPVGKYISTTEPHELNHWLEKNSFRLTEKNRKTLVLLINKAKFDLGMKSNKHLEHAELDEYFEENNSKWVDKFDSKQLP